MGQHRRHISGRARGIRRARPRRVGADPRGGYALLAKVASLSSASLLSWSSMTPTLMYRPKLDWKRAHLSSSFCRSLNICATVARRAPRAEWVSCVKQGVGEPRVSIVAACSRALDRATRRVGMHAISSG
eukprot:99607-Prymnesium_polylepis.1